MFLIRTAFWLTLVIMLLPTNKDEQRTVYGAAEAAVRDMSSFCTRNPDVCIKSRDAFDVFSQKAQFGATMVMDFMSGMTSETGQSETAHRAGENASRYPASFREDPQNTLTDQDREPGWFGSFSNRSRNDT